MKHQKYQYYKFQITIWKITNNKTYESGLISVLSNMYPMQQKDIIVGGTIGATLKIARTIKGTGHKDPIMAISTPPLQPM